MTDQPRRKGPPGPAPPVDESTYGGSSAETGGLYDDAGPTTANPEGDTMSEREEENPGPESTAMDSERTSARPDVGEVHRSAP